MTVIARAIPKELIKASVVYLALQKAHREIPLFFT
jgi:hypothetical protein